MKKDRIYLNLYKKIFAAVALTALLLSTLASCQPGDGASTSSPDTSAPLSPATSDSASVADTTGTPSTGTPSTGASSGTESTTAPALPSLSIPDGAIDAAQAIIYDVTSRRVLYSRNQVIDGKTYPASTTKLFTSWLALQYLSPDEVVTAGDELSLLASDASIAYIKRGHKLTASMLVEAMMLPSGGDAAYVIAAAAGKKIYGSDSVSAETAVKAFVNEMNRRLAALGFSGTHFTNPDGYHDPDHYTTLEDMAGIAALALENSTIMKYTTLPSDRVIYASGQTNSWTNTNELIQPESLYYCADAIGLKTGSTDEAGYCVMTATKGQDGRYYIIGVFGATTSFSRFTDAAVLIEYVLGKR
ncbi:MAG: hypothetical protein MR379_00820 [Clostridiales bacterium]|nr:hypothetical protein [Clostridiales bacterium]